jgi:eukaryotic-like serine/threonine-protein kinase
MHFSRAVKILDDSEETLRRVPKNLARFPDLHSTVFVRSRHNIHHSPAHEVWNMPAPANLPEFLDVIKKSGLVPEDRLSAELNRLKSTSSTPTSIDALAQAFIDSGLLTRFQAKQVKLGRYKRFEVAAKYRLLELLGVGGMGAVYLCEHMFMKRLVALKVLPVEKLQDPSALLRFYREARAVAALDHQNIVRAYDIDKFEQMHFLVMEYVDGVSIQEIVARHGPLDPYRAANYVAQSAHGLHHAHQLGMVHRDIKPGNLLLERTGYVKILDMGLARFFDQKNDNVTEKFDNNCVLGTADYLAPEQAVSNVVDIRADIYALGGTFYFMLTGQSPFPDGTIAHKLLCHQNEEPKPVTDFRGDVPSDILVVLDRMMRKDPEERYQTPEELHDALLQIVEEAAVPPPVSEMPDLCPAVLSLVGHSADKVRTGAGRLVPSRAAAGPGSSIVRTRQGPGSGGSAGRDVNLGGGSSAKYREGQSPTAKSQHTAPMNPPQFNPNDSVVELDRLGRTPRPVPAGSDSSKRFLVYGLLGGLGIAVLLAAVTIAVVLATK